MKKYTLQFLAVILTLIISVLGAVAQETPRKNSETADGKSVLEAKAEFLAAFKKMRTALKIRITAEANINNKTFENVVYEYVAPNKYYRLLKKNREGKNFEFETIEIAGRQFEKQGDQWVRESSLFIPIKDEIDLARAPQFESSKKDLFKIISLDVEYLGEEESCGQTFKIYKYTLIDEILPTGGKIWVRDGLLVRRESSTLPGCLNTITSKAEYDYEAKVKIQKPQIARR